MLTIRCAGPRQTFWERHPDHPNGEIFVSGDATAKAARTTTVARLLAAGELVEVKPAPRRRKRSK